MMTEPTVEMTLNELVEIAKSYNNDENVALYMRMKDGEKKTRFIIKVNEIIKESQKPLPQPPAQDEFGEPIQQQRQRPLPPAPRPAKPMPKDDVNNSWKSPRPVPTVQTPTPEEEGFMEADEMP